jgi:hypothetical protein
MRWEVKSAQPVGNLQSEVAEFVVIRMLCSAELCVECRPCEIFYDSKACEFLDVRDALEAPDDGPVPSPMGDQSPNPRITPSNFILFALDLAQD